MNIFVTGCLGYIGGTFSYEALKKGHKVYGLDNFINSKKDVIEKISSEFQDNFLFEQIDIGTDAKDLEKFLIKSDPEVVVHFAGLKAVGESEKQPLAYWENNLMGTLNLIKSMQKSKTKSIVFSSSGTVYGNSKVEPVNEDSYLSKNSKYGSTKLSIE
jgi:UDP-glucose 4-epimerase